MVARISCEAFCLFFLYGWRAARKMSVIVCVRFRDAAVPDKGQGSHLEACFLRLMHHVGSSWKHVGTDRVACHDNVDHVYGGRDVVKGAVQ